MASVNVLLYVLTSAASLSLSGIFQILVKRLKLLGKMREKGPPPPSVLLSMQEAVHGLGSQD